MRADSEGGAYTDIEGVKARTYEIKTGDKFIKVKFTAIGSYTGTPISEVIAVAEVVPDTTAPVLEEVTPAEGLVELAHDENFVLTVKASDENLYELEVDHSLEDLLPEFSVYASADNPYGTEALKEEFEAKGLSIEYDADAQTWTIDFGEIVTATFVENGITFYLVAIDEAGNQSGSMYEVTDEMTFAYTVTKAEAPDTTAPVLEEVTPAEGLVELAHDENFVLTVKASDENLYELEVDHSLEGTLPEFSVYASADNPYGTEALKGEFEAKGLSVEYDEETQTWTIDFGETVTDTFVENGITFYLVAIDEAGNQSGSMYEVTEDMTFAYTVEKAEAVIAVTGVKLNKNELTLTVDETEILRATVSPTDATNKKVTWLSNEEDIATVDQDGSVTAVSAGEATITVTTEDGNYTAEATVTVELSDEAILGNFVDGLTTEATEDFADLDVNLDTKINEISGTGRIAALFEAIFNPGQGIEVKSFDGIEKTKEENFTGYDVTLYKDTLISEVSGTGAMADLVAGLPENVTVTSIAGVDITELTDAQIMAQVKAALVGLMEAQSEDNTLGKLDGKSISYDVVFTKGEASQTATFTVTYATSKLKQDESLFYQSQ